MGTDDTELENSAVGSKRSGFGTGGSLGGECSVIGTIGTSCDKYEMAELVSLMGSLVEFELGRNIFLELKSLVPKL